ncbi:MAG TPA: hypothetical protein VGE97_02095, partial [Nitrososphaera sp.]
SDFTLMRHLVINLDKSGIDVPTYAWGIRIQKLFEEYGVGLETGESMLEELLTKCYRLKWPPQEAIATLKRFNDCAGEYKYTPHEYSLYASREMARFRKYHTLVNEEKQKLTRFKVKNLLTTGNLSLLSSKIHPPGLILLHESRLYKSKYYELLRDTKQNRNLRVDAENLKKLNDKGSFGGITEEIVLEKIEAIARHPDEFSYLFDNEALAILSDSTGSATEVEDEEISDYAHTEEIGQTNTGK